ncbi:MAG: hypothetical protein ABIV50_13105 [Opitutus sp.]
MNSPKFSQDPDQSFGGNEPRSSVAQAARETASKIGSAASETAARVRDSAVKLVSDRKDSAADRVGAYSSAIHESAKSLEEQDPNIAWITHRAAEKLESVATYMRTRDFRGLRDDAENLARRHPAAFFGGMCVAGLVLGSVIRAARQASTESPAPSDSDPQSSGSSDSEYPSYMNQGSSYAAQEAKPSNLADSSVSGTTPASGI